MADKIYDVEVTITKTVRVRVPADDPEVVYPGEKPSPKNSALAAKMGGRNTSFRKMRITKSRASERSCPNPLNTAAMEPMMELHHRKPQGFAFTRWGGRRCPSQSPGTGEESRASFSPQKGSA